MNKKALLYMLRGRTLICGLILLALMSAILTRLYVVQCIDGNIYTEAVKRQALRFIITPPVRGQIFAADGTLLAGNVSHYDLTLHPSLMRHPRGRLITSSYMLNTATFLQEKIMMRPTELKSIRELRLDMTRNMSQPYTLFKDLTPQEMARCEEMTPQIKGIAITPRLERHHPFPELATHILGFTAWRQRENTLQLSSSRNAVYTSKEMTGREGLERKFNDLLTGTPGIEAVIVDTNGFVRNKLPNETQAINGNDIWLTLDMKAQAAAQEALQGHRGAIVVLDIHTGAVLAMASSPTYSLDNLDAKQYAPLLKDKENHPLMNRAVNGSYMPGSIVKPLVALTALKEQVQTPEDTYNCDGTFRINQLVIRCAKRRGHGVLNMTEALTASCNPYFLNTGILCGIDKLHPMFTAAGFGRFTGIELSEFQKGICPARELARRYYKTAWNTGHTAFISIGQGPIEVTPLQAAVYCAALANGGRVMRPYIIHHITNDQGQILRLTSPLVRNQLPVTQQHLAVVQKGMRDDVVQNDASAHILTRAPIALAAKTGTAEVGPRDKRKKNTWLICFGPIPKPTFAIACVIEEGESGGRTTAPIVLKFIRQWDPNK